jgi:hypothetical protein
MILPYSRDIGPILVACNSYVGDVSLAPLGIQRLGSSAALALAGMGEIRRADRGLPPQADSNMTATAW